MTLENNKNNEFYLKVAYFVSLTGASILFGFSLTLNKFKKDLAGPDVSPRAQVYQEGAALARKALLKGTLYSFCGFGLVAITSYHLFGKSLIQDFKSKTKDREQQCQE